MSLARVAPEERIARAVCQRLNFREDREVLGLEVRDFCEFELIEV